MKIGIVTQPLSRNYGGILQNYALQQTLIALGHTPYTFDLGAFGWGDVVETNIKSIVKRLIGRPANFVTTPQQYALSELPLRRFVESHISLIKPRSKRPTAAKIAEYGLEALVVGSDQVWRPRYNYAIEDMYLGFARTLNIRRIAYAASFGTEEWEYSEAQATKCRELITMFDAISVRESSAVALCREHFSVEATHLLDPTLLLTAEEYNTLTTSIPKRKEPILFAYLLDRSEEKLLFINKKAKQLGVTAVIMGAGEDINTNDCIELWLSYFRDAQYVITDSFHGCVFSIIYNCNFTVISNNMRGNSRMLSLLQQLDIKGRYIESFDDDIVNSIIDWKEVNMRLNNLRILSKNFLTLNID